MTNDVENLITDADVNDAEGCETLGPSYFTARRVAEHVMKGFEDEHFKPLLDEFSKQFMDKLWSHVSDSLVMDAELNVQNYLWRTVDEVVKALLSGERWAVQKYALGERYNCDNVRAAIARHIPKELQDARVADLEATIERLTNDLKFYRDRY